MLLDCCSTDLDIISDTTVRNSNKKKTRKKISWLSAFGGETRSTVFLFTIIVSMMLARKMFCQLSRIGNGSGFMWRGLHNFSGYQRTATCRVNGPSSSIFVSQLGHCHTPCLSSDFLNWNTPPIGHRSFSGKCVFWVNTCNMHRTWQYYASSK